MTRPARRSPIEVRTSAGRPVAAQQGRPQWPRCRQRATRGWPTPLAVGPHRRRHRRPARAPEATGRRRRAAPAAASALASGISMPCPTAQAHLQQATLRLQAGAGELAAEELRASQSASDEITGRFDADAFAGAHLLELLHRQVADPAGERQRRRRRQAPVCAERPATALRRRRQASAPTNGKTPGGPSRPPFLWGGSGNSFVKVTRTTEMA